MKRDVEQEAEAFEILRDGLEQHARRVATAAHDLRQARELLREAEAKLERCEKLVKERELELVSVKEDLLGATAGLDRWGDEEV